MQLANLGFNVLNKKITILTFLTVCQICNCLKVSKVLQIGVAVKMIRLKLCGFKYVRSPCKWL